MFPIRDFFNIDLFDALLQQMSDPIDNQSGGSLPARQLEKASSFFLKKFKCYQDTLKIKINSKSDDFTNINQQLSAVFTELLEYIDSKTTNDNNKVRVTLFHQVLDKPIYTPFVAFKQFTSQMITDAFQNVRQSKNDLQIDSDLEVIVQIAQIPSGRQLQFVDNTVKNKTGIFINKNNDNYCAIHAILIAKYYCDHKICVQNKTNSINYKKDIYELSKLRAVNSKHRNKDLDKIVKILRFENKKQLNLKHIAMIELCLKYYRIQVIDEYGEIIYKGQNQLAT